MVRITIYSVLWLLFAAVSSQAQVASHKDHLFAWPGLLAGSWETGYAVVDYNKQRDIHQRDEIPERRASRAYVDMSVRRAQGDLTIPTIVGDVDVVATGQSANARFIVIYVHGQGGNRRQGANDYTFGGNFNRLKNIVAKSGALYLSPDISGFDERGIAQVASLIGRARGSGMAGAKVIVACASQGGAICNGLALSPVGGTLGGLIFLGASPDGRLLESSAYKNNVPIYIGHGSEDSVFAIAKVESFFRRMAVDGHPVRMVRFETGSHGTPIRMIDWRQVLDWMVRR